MTFWLDANLDPALAPWLGTTFKVTASHVRELTLHTLPDRELFEAARRLRVTVIMTKDSDFVDLVTLLGTPPQVLLLTCGNMRTPALQFLLTKNFPSALDHLAAGTPWVEIG